MADQTDPCEPARRDDSVRRVVERFNPDDVPAALWQVIGPIVRRAVLAADPPDPVTARTLTSRVALYLRWAYEQGLALSDDIVFSPETIDRWAAVGLDNRVGGTRNNYRALVWHVGQAVLPDAYPDPRLPIGKSDPVRPYTTAEQRALRAYVHGLHTDRLRDGATALLGLGLGAGLTAAEIGDATAAWVEDTQTGLAIHVEGKRARRVPVVREWERAVHHALDRSDGYLFMPGKKRLKRVSILTEALPPADPKLNAQRTRVTWIVDHLDRGVALPALAEAAGVTIEQLGNYARFMRPVDPGVADRLLRGDR